MVYLTGDTHGNLDEKRLNFFNTLTKDDVVIILGDFGYFFRADLIDEYPNFPFTTISILGNHENYSLFELFEDDEIFGARCKKMKDNVYIIKNGEILNIDNKKFLCYGGALSIDKSMRIPYVSWWPEEIPSRADYMNAINNLEIIDWKIDYFLGHTCSEKICEDFFHYTYKINDPTEKQIEQLEYELKFHNCNYKYFFGHHHKLRITEKYVALYEDVWNVNEDRLISLANY